MCPQCDGRAVALPVLKKVFAKGLTRELWQKSRTLDSSGDGSCPACGRDMVEIPLGSGDNEKYLDVCLRCHFVWFDPQEYEAIPKAKQGADEEKDLSPQGKKCVALARIKLLEEQKDFQSYPDSWWELVLAFLGMPVECDYKGVHNKPIFTWGLSAVISVISIVALFNLEEAIGNMGLIPADFSRYFGLTFITSFFLHGGLFHLIGNLYFLVVFGDNVEDVMGWRAFLLLVGMSALVGDVAHILGDPRSTTPCIGASGGISGIITYYALTFPKTRVGMLVWFRWIRLPVSILLLFWITMQILGTFIQVSGFSNVSYIAHLGGAGTGFVFWLRNRKSCSEIEHAGSKKALAADR